MCPPRRSVHALQRMFLLRLSPKVAMSPLIAEDHTMLPTQYAQKLSIKMNVELGGGEKVFGRMQTGERCGRNRRDI